MKSKIAEKAIDEENNNKPFHKINMLHNGIMTMNGEGLLEKKKEWKFRME